MDLKDIKDLMNAMRRTLTKRLVIKKKDFELELERDSPLNDPGDFELNPSKDPLDHITLQKAAMNLSTIPTFPQNVPSVSQVEQKLPELVVKSPMVGTFYFSPSPDDPPFVKVGDRVEKDTVVCIIEAMKVMNEVKAGLSGIIAEILVENGHPVEFGTKLYRLK